MPRPFSAVGKSVPRYDLPQKLSGEALYAADIQLPGMLVGKIARSPHPHARILSVDAAAALRAPGVRAVLTSFDAPDGRIAPDLPILDAEVRFVGDEVAAVAAADEYAAVRAAAMLQVRYETLPFVTDARAAMRPGAPPVHPGGNLVGGKPITLARGDVDEGFAQADRVFEMRFTTPAHAGAALEPRAAVAKWDGDRLTIWKSTRGAHADRLNLSLALGVDRSLIRIIGATMGAGYGTKDETRLSVIAAVLARRAGSPVKIEAARAEEFVAGRKRHSTETAVKIGAANDGRITAIHATTIMDTGAYLSSGPGVVRRAGQAALYLYRCPNVRYDGYLVYTNQPSGGSYRALGAPQGHFALEVAMNRVADELGIDPLDFRLMNHVGIEGQEGERITPPDEIIDTQPVEGGVPFSSNGLRQCLDQGAEAFGWRDRHSPPSQRRQDAGGDGGANANADGGADDNAANSAAAVNIDADGGPDSVNTAAATNSVNADNDDDGLRRGSGMCMFIYRGGPGGKSAARLALNPDGSVQLSAGLMDVGEGSATVIAQIAAEALGVPYEAIRVAFGDTAHTPDAPLTAGSTATFSTGSAAVKAASELKAAILRAAAPRLNADAHSLDIADGQITRADGGPSVPLTELAARLTADAQPLPQAEASVTPGSKDYIVNSFGAHFVEVEVDTITGQVRVLRYLAAHDSGRILNPRLATNQVEGGVSQMLGFTLSEQMLTDPISGVTLNANFLEHKAPTIMEYPPIETLFVDVADPIGPFGAKALGEPPSIGPAPAIINAIHDAVGVRVQDLPATPDKILDALDALDAANQAPE